MSETSDKSKNSEPELKLPVREEIVTPSGNDFAAELRRFGPTGIVAILVIILSSNVFIGNVLVPLGAHWFYSGLIHHIHHGARSVTCGRKAGSAV